jgi:Uma2 family endonuclease
MLTSPLVKDNFSLEDFVANPPDRMEWVDGQLVEKNGMTLRHGEIQFRLARYWDDYKKSPADKVEKFTPMCLVVLISRDALLMWLILLLNW